MSLAATLSDRRIGLAPPVSQSVLGLGRPLARLWRSCFDETYRMERQRRNSWHLLYAAEREQWERTGSRARPSRAAYGS